MADGDNIPRMFSVNVPGLVSTYTQAGSNAQALAYALRQAFESRNEFRWNGRLYQGEVGLKALTSDLLNFGGFFDMVKELPGQPSDPVEIPLPQQAPATADMTGFAPPQDARAPATSNPPTTQPAPAAAPATASKDNGIEAIIRKAEDEGVQEGMVGPIVSEAARVLELSHGEQDALREALLVAASRHETAVKDGEGPGLEAVATRYCWKSAVRKGKAIPHTTENPDFHKGNPSGRAWLARRADRDQSVAHLQDNYAGFDEFLAYDSIYNLAQRLGYATPEDAWDANPMVQWSTDPRDFRTLDLPGYEGRKAAVGEESGSTESAEPKKEAEGADLLCASCGKKAPGDSLTLSQDGSGWRCPYCHHVNPMPKRAAKTAWLRTARETFGINIINPIRVEGDIEDGGNPSLVPIRLSQGVGGESFFDGKQWGYDLVLDELIDMGSGQRIPGAQLPSEVLREIDLQLGGEKRSESALSAPWRCEDCQAYLETDAAVRSHKLDTGHSSYKGLGGTPGFEEKESESAAGEATHYCPRCRKPSVSQADDGWMQCSDEANCGWMQDWKNPEKLRPIKKAEGESEPQAAMVKLSPGLPEGWEVQPGADLTDETQRRPGWAVKNFYVLDAATNVVGEGDTEEQAVQDALGKMGPQRAARMDARRGGIEDDLFQISESGGYTCPMCGKKGLTFFPGDKEDGSDGVWFCADNIAGKEDVGGCGFEFQGAEPPKPPSGRQAGLSKEAIGFLNKCRYCGAWINPEFGIDSPAEHAGAEGTEDDPRSPGDFDDVCDVCNYAHGRRGGPNFDPEKR